MDYSDSIIDYDDPYLYRPAEKLTLTEVRGRIAKEILYIRRLGLWHRNHDNPAGALYCREAVKILCELGWNVFPKRS